MSYFDTPVVRDGGGTAIQGGGRTNYLFSLVSAIRSLWDAQEVLSLSNIRSGYLHYFFAFPLALIFINVQDSLLASSLRVFGLPAITVTFFAFAAGATVMFIIYGVGNIHILSRISSVLTLIGFIPWLFLPDGYASFVCAAVFMTGVGCSMANSGITFMFALNNAERFFGCVLTILAIGFVKTNSVFIVQHTLLRLCIITILVGGISACMFRTKGADIAENSNREIKGYNPSIWLSLFILLSYFIIRILGFYVPEFQTPISPVLANVLVVIPALICVSMQMAFHRSVWTMCNVFFLSAILSYVMGFAGILGAANVFSMLKEIGFFVGFYLFTCVQNKFCDFRKHKIVALICILTIAATFVVPDLLIKTMLTHTVAVVVSASLFVAFLLLSPALSRYLFGADWSRDFARLYMSELEAQVALAKTEGTEKADPPPCEDELLTSEEIDVALLLIEGETRYVISRKLHRPIADVERQLRSIREKFISKGDADPGISAAKIAYKLTRRETDTLRCLCKNATNADIAAELMITEETARRHVRTLMAKLPVDDRKDVPAWVETPGLKTE